jgi:hypothetical protein
MQLPTRDLRFNQGTWVVSAGQLPAVAAQMVQALPAEKFDADFLGQDLTTTYFDTHGFALAKARRRGDKYLTLRLRSYEPAHVYALSVKTESHKLRLAIAEDLAAMLLADGLASTLWASLLTADLVARLMELTDTDLLVPIVAVCCRRYAVENAQDRLTLDVDIVTDTGKRFPAHVLEYKSTQDNPNVLLSLPLRPIKLSKFLWSVSY